MEFVAGTISGGGGRAGFESDVMFTNLGPEFVGSRESSEGCEERFSGADGAEGCGADGSG